jgi:hypothetical protein
VRPTIYLETTILSFLAARPSADGDVRALQELTQQWWSQRRGDYDLRVSEIVLREVRAGDAEAAARRLGLVRGIPLVGLTPEVDQLAERIALATAIPARAKADVFHHCGCNGPRHRLPADLEHEAPGESDPAAQGRSRLPIARLPSTDGLHARATARRLDDMNRDEVIEDVRRVRERLLAEAGSLRAFADELRKLETQETEKVLPPPPRREDLLRGEVA